MKDYKTLYEATKADLKDQIDFTTRLQEDLDRVNNAYTAYMNDSALRERVAVLVYNHGGSWYRKCADDMLAWIVGTPAEPPKPSLGKRLIKAAKQGRAIAKKSGKRRPYTKKSKFWAKKTKT